MSSSSRKFLLGTFNAEDLLTPAGYAASLFIPLSMLYHQYPACLPAQPANFHLLVPLHVIKDEMDDTIQDGDS